MNDLDTITMNEIQKRQTGVLKALNKQYGPEKAVSICEEFFNMYKYKHDAELHKDRQQVGWYIKRVEVLERYAAINYKVK